MAEGKKRQLAGGLDSGQVWVRWTPEIAEDYPAIADAVADFKAKGMKKGKDAADAATCWLKERSLPNYRTTVTWLMLNPAEDFVEGYYSLASAQVELRTDHRKKLGPSEYPIQPAALITWIAKDERSDIGGKQLLAHAVGIAVKVAQLQGVVAIVLDPFDDETAKIWRGAPYNFKSSLTKSADGQRRLWRHLVI
jgi:hypothetical protein